MAVKSMSRSSIATMVTSVVVVVAALRLARTLLIPFALAILFSFLLAPAVIRLQRRIGRVLAVTLVTVMATTTVGATSWLAAGQAADLVGKVSEYHHNILAKIQSVRGSLGNRFERASRAFGRISAELSSKSGVSAAPPVEALSSEQGLDADPKKPGWTAALAPWIGSLFAQVETAAVVTVLVIFMLMYHDDLRNRILRLIGTRRLNESTQAMNDAANLVSRYLLMQATINAGHGLAVGVGLYLIGLPTAFFLGIAAGLLRFIPYLGPVMATVMPIALALAVFDGWTMPLVTIVFLIVLEVLSNNVFEPWIYGKQTGLSPMSIIVAAIFWTWLWGGVGLLLSAPLTVCLVVLGKHVGQLKFLNILLSDEPALEPKDRFYQRLLAFDSEEALSIAREYLHGRSLQDVYDDILLPALSLAENDRHRGDLEEAQGQFVLETMRDVVEELGESDRESGASPAQFDSTSMTAPKSVPSLTVLCLPARDEADELAGMMFAQLLTLDGHQAKCLSTTALTGEMLEAVGTENVSLACISAVPPSALRHARFMWKRLRSRHTQLDIVVGLWGTVYDAGRLSPDAPDAATRVVSRMAEGREAVRELAEVISLRTEMVPTRGVR